MKVVVTVGNVIDVSADVLIATANPWLNMSGGVNGAICEREPEIQAELRQYLCKAGVKAMPAGTVVRTSAGGLPFSSIIHAIAIDPFYDSSNDIVGKALRAAFRLAESLNANTISMPTLATGYGPLTVDAFARAFVESVFGHFTIETVTIVVRTKEDAEEIEAVICGLR
jgi:O-acetyl-ADP-ribose deacetylase (regulator of RNase III)